MKKYLNICTISLLFAMVACKEEPVGLQPVDSVPPSPVDAATVTWDSIPGGAVFRFALPPDEDLLYVKALYTRDNGEECEAPATIFADSLRVVGFGKSIPQKAKLIAVDRSRNESTPITVEFQPGVPDVYYIGQSLNLFADDGGIRYQWSNPNRQKVSIRLMIKDNNGEYVPLETYYSDATTGNVMRVGMEPVAVDCAIYAQDRWGNTTEIKYYPQVVPLYEEMLDRTKMATLNLPGDAPDFPGGWPRSNMIDGRKGDDSGYSSESGHGNMPHAVTFDLGVEVKLSRIRIYQRCGQYIFSAGNPRIFDVYGCETLDQSGSWDSWTKLIHCESVKPSGLPLSEWNADDEKVAKEGEDFFCPRDFRPKVRYIRINVIEAWSPTDNIQINEVEFFGDNREELSNE